MIVHFPIAFGYLALFFEILSLLKPDKSNFKEISYYLTLFATIGAILSLLSGFFLTKKLEFGKLNEIIETHEMWALITTVSLIITSILKSYIFFKHKKGKILFISIICSLISVIAITITGHFGGMLVFYYLK